MRTEGPRLRPWEGACLYAKEVPECRGWARLSGAVFWVHRAEVRYGGGCRDRVGTGRHCATGATARWPPGFSLPVLGMRDEVVV